MIFFTLSYAENDTTSHRIKKTIENQNGYFSSPLLFSALLTGAKVRLLISDYTL